MNERWPRVPLASEFKLCSGKPVPFGSNGFVPVYGGNGVGGSVGVALTEDQTFVIGRVGENCGSVHLTAGPSWITDNALWATRIQDGWNLAFVAAYLQWYDLGRFKSRTGQPLVNQRQIGKVLLPKPTLAEQRRIVEVLDAVAKAKHSVELAIAKLMRVREGQLSAALDSLDGIPMRTVAEFFEVRSGITLGPDRRPRNSTRPYLRVANVQRDHIDLSDVAALEEFPGDSAKYSLAAGDLLVVEGHANPHEIGRCALVGSEAAGLLYQNHLFRLRSSLVNPQFSQMWLNSKTAKSYWLGTAATSSGLYTINRSMVEEMPFPALSTGEQVGLVDKVSTFDNRVRFEVDSLNKLRIIERGLMDDLLTGRLRAEEI
ncbi:MAG: hypothetical protein JO362_05425 [Streptomycetaceae bacterium]|nr:hypothetical protein [Streptomycetaceae bacterium]